MVPRVRFTSWLFPFFVEFYGESIESFIRPKTVRFLLMQRLSTSQIFKRSEPIKLIAGGYEDNEFSTSRAGVMLSRNCFSPISPLFV